MRELISEIQENASVIMTCITQEISDLKHQLEIQLMKNTPVNSRG